MPQGGQFSAAVDTRNCMACEMNLFLEWFTIDDKTWAQIGLARNAGCLCIGCLEQRIGRPLCRQDFPSSRNNHPTEYVSDRFLSRLGFDLVCEDDNGTRVSREDAQPWTRDYEGPAP